MAGRAGGLVSSKERHADWTAQAVHGGSGGTVPCTGSGRPSWRHTAATAGPGVKQGAVAPDQVRCGQGLKRRYRSRHIDLGPEDSDLTIQAAEDAKARLYGRCRVPG
jgi:hypothetical protein